MNIIEEQLFLLRLEFVRLALDEFRGNGEVDSNRQADLRELLRQSETGVEKKLSIEELFSRVSRVLTSSESLRIQAEIAGTLKAQSGSVEPAQRILPQTLTSSEFLEMDVREQEQLLDRILLTLLESTRKLELGYFPDEFKNKDHFRKLLSIPGTRLILEVDNDIVSGFELLLLGDLPDQFQQLQEEYHSRYGKIGVYRLLCIHPDYRGRGLYDRLDTKATLECVGIANVVVGRVLMYPNPNRVAVAHLKRGHIPLNEVYQDSNGSVWAVFAASINRFLRRENKANGILNIVQEHSEYVFGAWEELSEKHVNS